MAIKLLSATALLALVASASFSVTAVATCAPASCASSSTAVKTQVCGSDGVTYSSLCELELAKCATPSLQLASQNGCANGIAPPKKCDQECGDHASLICGSDGVTYLNACHFDRAYCEDKTLVPMGYGACSTAPSTSLRR
ncbi:Protease inhibitor epi11 [Globisporangium polare]